MKNFESGVDQKIIIKVCSKISNHDPVEKSKSMPDKKIESGSA